MPLSFTVENGRVYITNASAAMAKYIGWEITAVNNIVNGRDPQLDAGLRYLRLR